LAFDHGRGTSSLTDSDVGAENSHRDRDLDPWSTVDGNSTLILAGPETKIAAINEAVVAFEVDDCDPGTERGWSVLLQAGAREVNESDRRARARSLLAASARSSAARVVEVEMEVVTGRGVGAPERHRDLKA
jgi:hypothetical protein